MKIVVDKKIKTINEEVENLILKNQSVQEQDNIRTSDILIAPNDDYEVDSLSADGFYGISIESDNEVTVKIQSLDNYVVNSIGLTSFDFVGNIPSAKITIENNSATDDAKIKLVLVG